MLKALKGCPRAKTLKLTVKHTQHELYMPTTCKTWRCSYCRKIREIQLKNLIVYGYTRLKPCEFITVTVKRERDGTCLDADSVKKAWTQWLRTVKKSRGKMPWLKVVELTKNGVPHFHLITGSWTRKNQKTRCRPLEWDAYKKGWYYSCKAAEECLHCEVGRLWYEATGNSFVVDARPVVDEGVGAYFVKEYLLKSYSQMEARIEAGYPRLWSASRDWPRIPIAVRGTLEGLWQETKILKPGPFDKEVHQKVRESRKSKLLEVFTDEWMEPIRAKAQKKSKLSRIRRINDTFI